MGRSEPATTGEHWREPFDLRAGSWHAQAFLDYVDAKGPYAEFCRFDERPSLGLPHTMRAADAIAAEDKAWRHIINRA